MLKVLIFGTGKIANAIMQGIVKNDGMGYHVQGVIDNDPKKYLTNFYGYNVHHPGQLDNYDYDYIILCLDNDEKVVQQLTLGYHVDDGRIKKYPFLLQIAMTFKYRDSTDNDIQKILNYWAAGHSISVFNCFAEKQNDELEVIWDKKTNYPYVMFPTIDGRTKRMYFPRNHHFDVCDGQMVVRNMFYEQQNGSPHRYIQRCHDIKEGDIIADVGTCEGNFALRYVNVASRIYIFENNPDWIDALYHTFSHELEKVIIYDKCVANRTGEKTIKLDDAIDSSCDFVKMDIEGFEVDALVGAQNLLERNNLKLSVCCYHRYHDEESIKNMIEKVDGYKTSTSSGYMCFFEDTNIFYHLDFRRGIVYGKRE